MVLCCATQMPTVRPFTGRNQKVFQITVLLPALFSPWCPSMCPKEAFSHAIAKPPMKQFSFWKASCLALGCVLTWCQLRAAGLVSKMERERERTLSSFSCLFLLLSSLALWVRHFKSTSIKHCTSSTWNTQSLGGIDKHPGPGVVKRCMAAWLPRPRLPEQTWHGNVLLSCGPHKLGPTQQLNEFNAEFVPWPCWSRRSIVVFFPRFDNFMIYDDKITYQIWIDLFDLWMTWNIPIQVQSVENNGSLAGMNCVASCLTIWQFSLGVTSALFTDSEKQKNKNMWQEGDIHCQKTMAVFLHPAVFKIALLCFWSDLKLGLGFSCRNDGGCNC